MPICVETSQGQVPGHGEHGQQTQEQVVSLTSTKRLEARSSAAVADRTASTSATIACRDAALDCFAACRK